MKSYSFNTYLWLMGTLLVFLFLFGLIVLNSYLVEQKRRDFRKADYCIGNGFDFANGHLVTSKFIKREVIWTKDESSSAYSYLYTKYNLGHDKPLVKYSEWQFFVKNYFISIDNFPNLLKDKDWWHIWNWHFHFFNDILSNTADNGIPINAIFFNYLENNDLPIEEVQQAYKECVRLFDNGDQFARFIFDFIDSHEKQATVVLIAQAAQTGELPQDADWFKMVRHIIKFRDDFPDNLPEAVMDKLLSANLPFHGDLGEMSFSLYNYLLRPTEYNALYVALYETGGLSISSKWRDDNCPIELKEEFAILQKHGLLEKFLSQVYSDDVETPPLPSPAIPPSGDDDHQGYNIYDTNTYGNLPQREKLLKISCFPEIFRTYWQEKLKKLQEKQKAQ